MTSFKSTALAATALCALLSACQSATPIYPTTQPAQPVQPPPPPPPPPPAPPQDNSIQAAPTTPVQSSALPPPPGATEAPPRPTRSSRQTRPPCIESAAPPAPAMVTKEVPAHGPGSGKVIEEAGAVKVEKGVTLYSISRKAGLSVDELAKLNHIKKPYRLKLGEEIKLPGKRAYEVVSGDTLYSIAKRFGLDAKDLADLNKIDNDRGLHAGQKIDLPGDAKDKGAPTTTITVPGPRPRPSRRAACPPVETPTPDLGTASPSPSPAQTLAPVAPAPPMVKPPASQPPVGQIPAGQTPAVPPASTAEAPATAADSDVAAAGRGLFVWPVRGDLINTFGQKGAIRSDGVDIGATQGDSVRAAAAGEVVYAGNAVQGFGNLVLIKHDGGWVTAYAHLASIEVKMRQTVTQGQEIGLVGVSGGVDRPQLHFEIRYAPTPKDKARPIDPMLVLPVQ